MRDRELVTSDEFWKERVWRELNRLNMPDAGGAFSRPGTAQADEQRRLNRLYGTAGTEMSLRFQCNRRFAEAGAVINATQMTRSSMTPRKQAARSMGASSSRGTGSNMGDFNDPFNFGEYFEPEVPGLLPQRAVNSGQHELEVPSHPSQKMAEKSPFSDTASLTSVEVPGLPPQRAVNSGQHELEVPSHPSQNMAVKSLFSDAASLTSVVGSRPGSRSTSHRAASARHTYFTQRPNSQLSYH